MKEVEGWHTFLETLSSWLALQEEAFVRELQLCPGEDRDSADEAPFGHCREELEAVLLPHPVAC